MKFLSIFLAASISTAAYSYDLPECQVEKPQPGDLAAAKAAAEQLEQKCLPKGRKINECLTRVRLLSESISGFIGKFRKPKENFPLLVNTSISGNFDMNRSDISIWRNFLSLEEQYNKSLDVVASLASKYKESAAESQSLQAQLSELDKDYVIAAKTIRELGNNEYTLTVFIESLKLDLEKRYDLVKAEIAYLQSDSCKEAEIGGVVSQLDKAFVAFGVDTDIILTHIREAKKARQNLLNYTYTALRDALETNYRQYLLNDLSMLGGKIDVVIRASQLSAKFENWFTWASLEPSRDKVQTVYQQFENSRLILAADLVTATDYKEQMLQVSEAYPETAQLYLARMDAAIADIKRRLDRLDAKGWTGYLESQKAVANRIMARPDRLSADCLQLYRNFFSAAAGVNSLESYRPVEKLYMAAVVGCSKEKQ